ncbi:MAG: hypothetical protein AVDCRST_MAG17-1225 [uncultured Solirubrobacterales bacterium]|uniref:Uncharacterized protein n=1 Tax=uncultured Solirubrobacterales bacterium TaxID=768556 RepID=A0A6J4SH05_9ACTN|nr:MAG: hypothetical protein AVDCRST_MAG17-1225 [uncultured Solirubrobacterales bacterium]
MNSRPKPPPALQKAGRKLWGAVLRDAPENVILDGRERSSLATACAQADQNSSSRRRSGGTE